MHIIGDGVSDMHTVGHSSNLIAAARVNVELGCEVATDICDCHLLFE